MTPHQEQQEPPVRGGEQVFYLIAIAGGCAIFAGVLAWVLGY